MSDNYNDISKDTSNLRADTTIKKANIENAALTITNDINKWYSEHHTQKLESRLKTNIEQEDTDGITTAVEEVEGIQTNVNTEESTESVTNSNDIKTNINQNNNSKIKTRSSDFSEISDDENSAQSTGNSKIKTKVSNKQTEIAESQSKKKKDPNDKIQTKINRTQKGSKIVSGAIKTKQVANRTTKYLVKKGKQVQSVSSGNIAESFSSNLKDTSKRTAGKTFDLTTRKIRQKVRNKIVTITAKAIKAVAKALLELLKALMSLLIKVLPAIVILVVLVLLIAVAIGSTSMVFGEYADDSTLNSYVDYMNATEDELGTTVDWKAVCAVIYGLDMDIQYDEAEQYLLQQFKDADLYRNGSKVKDYTNWLNEHYSVVKTFYEKKGKSDDSESLSKEDINFMKELYDTDDFMKLIDEKRSSSVNTGSSTGSSGDGKHSGKLSYPTTYHKISAGYPNYSSGRYHGGVDFPCPTGTPVKAAESGKVIVAKELNYSYGHYLIIDHGNGLSTLYAHNSRLLVGVGGHVEKGQTIAKSGSTGKSTGPHCHFEVRVNGTRVNPLNYL